MKKWLLLFAVVVVMASTAYVSMRRTIASTRLPVTDALKREVPDLDFEQIVPEPKIRNLDIGGNRTKSAVGSEDAVIIYSLRFKSITDAVEYRYSLPEHMVLAMLAQESQGAILLNGIDDGGAGYCHMQPSTASEFGLKIYQDCRVLVSRVHGRALRTLLREKKESLPVLAEYDDRLHPIINLDAVGRMLAIYIQQSPPKHKAYDGTDSMQAAVFYYSGRQEYWNKLVEFRKKFSASSVAEVRKRFNARNVNLTINGTPADFDRYLAAMWQGWDNFGLRKYQKLDLYAPTGIEQINRIYGHPPRL